MSDEYSDPSCKIHCTILSPPAHSQVGARGGDGGRDFFHPWEGNSPGNRARTGKSPIKQGVCGFSPSEILSKTFFNFFSKPPCAHS